MIYKNKNLLSLYPETERACPLITTKEFEAQREGYTQHGRDYDFDLNFFDNFKKLYDTTPLAALLNRSGADNSDFAFSVHMSRNCYLSFTVITDCENILYSFTVKENCANVLNSSQVRNNSQNVYTSL